MLSWCCQYECYETATEYICKSCGAKKQKMIEETLCPDCNGPMVSRKSEFGVFWGCKAYPKCKGTRDSMGRSKKERDEWKKQQDKEDHEDIGPDPVSPPDSTYRWKK